MKHLDIRALRDEGKAAFGSGAQTASCPYPEHSNERDAWVFGWWRAFYSLRDQDAARISQWLLDELSLISNKTQADAIAMILVTRADYDRTRPIEDNRLGGIEFTIPAPSSL